MKKNDNDLIYDKNKIFIFSIKEKNKPLKIIFNELPCPIRKNYRCEYSKFINSEDFNFSLQCELRVCDKFIIIKSE